MRLTRRSFVSFAACLAAAGAAVLAPVATQPAAAASLQQVTNFGSNPGNLQMYVYVPSSAKAKPPILVAMHTCGGTAQGFFQATEFSKLADQYGFIVIYPSASSKKMNCFDNWSAASKVRGGATDETSIMSMVTYVEQHNSGDANRVYATGSSSGGMMTDAMLALYPDVFKAGAAFMGVPFGCFPQESDYLAANSVCANGNNDKTPQQWGDLARQAYPGFTGKYPPIQLWHGTADPVVNYKNLQEEVDQWTNLNGVSVTPTSSDAPQSGWTRKRFADSAGNVRVEAISVANAGHVLPQSGMAAQAIAFMGLNKTTAG